MKCEQAEELISALIDNELSDPERTSLEGHFRDCPRCKGAYERERDLNSEIRRVGLSVIAPFDLRRRIQSDQRGLPKEADYSGGESQKRFWLHPFYRPALAFVIVVVLGVAIFLVKQPLRQPISLTALQIQAKIAAGTVSLRGASSQDELHDWLRRAVDGKFGPLGYDFSSLNVKPVGGMVQEVEGRQMLVAVFRGNGLSITCFTFLGTEEDAPKNAAIIFDPEKKMRFYTFSRNGMHAVLHREGNVICLLVSNMPPDELLALVRGASPHKHWPNPVDKDQANG
jgi:putative zinc finger protein